MAKDALIERTYSARPGDRDRPWIVIDADGLVLGRLAALVATRLRGKHDPRFTPHMEMGDHVIIVNADKVQLTGRKRTDKIYYRHTGYPGGIRQRTARDILEGQHPERLIVQAVRRMLPGNRLSRRLMTRLRVYAGPDHPHEAQHPEPCDVAAMNPKNTRDRAGTARMQ